MAKKTQKEKALGHILDAMREIAVNLYREMDPQAVTVNADAMLKLSEAYAKIESADNSELSRQISTLVKLAQMEELQI